MPNLSTTPKGIGRGHPVHAPLPQPLKDGKLTYCKAAFATFPLEKDTPYRLEVKKIGKTLTVYVAGHLFGYTDDALPDACYVGITGCEGLNRFYDFSVSR